MIKKAARQLMEGEHKFTDKFGDNKRILADTMPSKPLRNKIAGSTTIDTFLFIDYCECSTGLTYTCRERI